MSSELRKNLDEAGLYEVYASSGQGAAPMSSPSSGRGRMLSFLASLAGDPGQTRAVVDLGCGTGDLLLTLMAQGHREVRGVDLSSEQIARAHESIQPLVSVGAAGEYLDSLDGESVSAVFAIDLLEHLQLQNLVELAGQVHRVLMPGGRFIVQVPNGLGVNGGHVLFGDLTHVRAFTESSVTQLAQAVGLEVLVCRSSNNWHGAIVDRTRSALCELLWLRRRLELGVETGAWSAPLTRNLISVLGRPGSS